IDTPLILNSTYQLSIQDVQNEALTLPIFPNPTVKSFTYGYIVATNDFNNVYFPSNTLAATGIGNNMTIYNSAWVTNGVVHLSDAVNNQSGGLKVTNINNGAPVNRFVIRYRQNISGVSTAIGNTLQPYGTQNPA